ncbi:MAG: HNH endonuclease [Oscillospiraceae bacterium]|nr:HNH endonuclease [Oscillospiraceae bacterium]
MVKLKKSVLPEGTKINNKNDYQTGIVFQTLYKDCYEKCYICEHKKPLPPVVEHIIAHKGNRDLMLNWSNLLLACSYCNTVKNKREFNEGIINPVEIDPEDYILFELSFDEFTESVGISHKGDSTDNLLSDKTVKLLNQVYNNTSKRDGQKVSSATLRDFLTRVMRDFYVLVDNYKTEQDTGNYQVIIDEISRSSEFAAFKRQIVRDDPELSIIFADSLV